jgi:2-hydroxychromene-2-carboxylate isomerase
MTTLQFFFDFISPYAYLANERIDQLAERNQCVVQRRPVLLAGLLNHNQQRGPAEIPDKRLYTCKNVVRLAHDLGLPIQPPPAHPFNSLLPLRICNLRPEAGLVTHLFRACWKDGRAIDTPGALKDLIDEDTLLRAGQAPAKELLKKNGQEALELGVFGVPTVVVDGEVFWGLDSFAHLERYLQGGDPVTPELAEKWENLPASASRFSANSAAE